MCDSIDRSPRERLNCYTNLDQAEDRWCSRQWLGWCRVGPTQSPTGCRARRRGRRDPSGPCGSLHWVRNENASHVALLLKCGAEKGSEESVPYLKDLNSSTNSTKLMLLSETMKLWKPFIPPLMRPCQLLLLQALQEKHGLNGQDGPLSALLPQQMLSR